MWNTFMYIFAILFHAINSCIMYCIHEHWRFSDKSLVPVPCCGLFISPLHLFPQLLIQPSSVKQTSDLFIPIINVSVYDPAWACLSLANFYGLHVG